MFNSECGIRNAELRKHSSWVALCASEGRRPRRPQASSPANGPSPADNLCSARRSAVPCRRRILSRKERKERKEMKGGNGAIGEPRV